MKKMGGVALGGRILANRLEPCFIPSITCLPVSTASYYSNNLKTVEDTFSL